VPLVHPQRFTAPPESIADLLRSDRHWHLVRGEVLPAQPAGAPVLRLPYELPSEASRPTVLARVDVEETQAWTRPRLTTVERGRDFYLGDETGVALVQLADDAGRLHPDVELHLASPFREHTLQRGPVTMSAFVRTLCAGDPIYVLGRVRLVPPPPGEWLGPGLRDVPLLPAFAGALGPLHLYDEPAFQQLAAWYALPWYRKLSLLVRNR
jgi:hypothetical protein